MADQNITSLGLLGIVTGLELRGSRILVTIDTTDTEFQKDPVALNQLVVVRPKVKDL